MASTAEFVQYVADQLSDAGTITYRRMFGEYGLYCDGLFFAVVCDNQLFLKPTQAAQKLLAAPVLRPPYPGASPSLLVEDTEDRALLCQLAKATCSALPPPRPKRTQKPNKKRG